MTGTQTINFCAVHVCTCVLMLCQCGHEMRHIQIQNTNKMYIAPGILKRIRAQTHGVTIEGKDETKKGVILVAI